MSEAFEYELYTEAAIATWLERRAESYEGDAKRALQLAAEDLKSGAWNHRPSMYAPSIEDQE